MKLSDKLKQHRDLIEDKLRGLYETHKGPAGGVVFMQHDGTYVECWTHDEPEKMNWDTAREYVQTLNHGGYSDWSLPTIDETLEMYQNRYRIGNFENDWYWSDNEDSEFDAWLRDFSTGLKKNSYFKTNKLKVRAVRRFK